MGILTEADKDKINQLIAHTKISFDEITKETLSLEEAAKELNITKEGLCYKLNKHYPGLFIRVPFHKHRPFRIPKLLVKHIKKNNT